MTFFKALTVFVVCISIFRIIISNSTTVGNKNNSTKDNVLVTGYVKCPLCTHDCFLTVILNERGEYYTENKSCNKTFYINRYLNEPKTEDYQASFYLFSGNKTVKIVSNKNPKFMTEVYKTYVCEFGTINLITPKIEKIVREEML